MKEKQYRRDILKTGGVASGLVILPPASASNDRESKHGDSGKFKIVNNRQEKIETTISLRTSRSRKPVEEQEITLPNRTPKENEKLHVEQKSLKPPRQGRYKLKVSTSSGNSESTQSSYLKKGSIRILH